MSVSCGVCVRDDVTQATDWGAAALARDRRGRDRALNLPPRRVNLPDVVVAEQAPPASKAEMAAIAALPKVQSTRLLGTLRQAEEYGAAVAEQIQPFLAAETPSQGK